jgi:hypothetical protein
MSRVLTTKAARKMAAQRKRFRGRQPGPKMPCGWGCGGAYSAREIRGHFTICPKRPKLIDRL